MNWRAFVDGVKTIFGRVVNVIPTPTLESKVLKGDGTWAYTAMVVGDDIVVTNTYATAFGGDSDPQDNGETASGINTKGNPNLKGCSLAMRVDGLKALKGSPIPKMPFGLQKVKGAWVSNPGGAHVDITFDNGLVVTDVPVIDLGPGKQASTPGDPHAIDLTVAVARLYSNQSDRALVRGFKAKVKSFRIINGAKIAITPLV